MKTDGKKGGIPWCAEFWIQALTDDDYGFFLDKAKEGSKKVIQGFFFLKKREKVVYQRNGLPLRFSPCLVLFAPIFLIVLFSPFFFCAGV